ncbi:Rv3235 family protein [Gordonia rhizosphera]|uniref:Uncharacterized protein n=1 Tax=Gordonia rhizosphera NBRC 16068 TaxID=1108045 RepID=K6WLD3_9ACTN|nr:Rv3235 family protein [Gordonia rhizosphera]GAB92957.1 hypothetical protein GORHZ_197_01140 [Gordonia rhizosphera NBRC 16068]
METPRVLIRPAPPYEPMARVVADAATDSTLDGAPRPVEPVVTDPSSVRDADPGAADESGRGGSRTVSATTLEARKFAISTITLLFEVLDRRRSLNQLDAHTTVHLLDHVAALARAQGTSRSTGAVEASATLRRMHVQMLGPGAAEIFGSYRRGERVRAFAGRIERRPRRVRTSVGSGPGLRRAVEYRWQLVAFSLA